jgi:predicted MFS family arabinose efflux permease
VVAATLGLFGLVYGFSSAETDGWGATITIVSLAAGVALLAAFVAIEHRSDRALLPLRVVTDRARGGAYAAIAIAGLGMFGVFLFLTYYLQRTLGFTPIETGLAFLPMIVFVVATATTTTARVLPRTGPRPIVPTGMALAAVGMVYLTGVEADSSYAAAVLPGLAVMGVGFGAIMAPSIATATGRVAPRDAGVASALVNTSQQVGGSLGVALLSTLAASAATDFAAGKAPSAQLAAEAAVHGYTTAFWWAAGMFAVGAIVTALLLPSGAPAVDPHAEPALAH